MKLYIKRNVDIDHVKWDNRLSLTPNIPAFQYTWFLNAVTDEWHAVIKDDYSLAFPFAVRQKFGFRYIYQPFFTRYFSACGSQTPISEILNTIPADYKLWDIAVDAGCDNLKGNFKAFEKKYQVLELNDSYPNLQANYSSKLRRNLRIAGEQNLHMENFDDSAKFVNSFKKHVGKALNTFNNKDYTRLENLVNACKANATTLMLSVKNNDGEIAAGVFVKTGNCLLYIEGYSSPLGREARAMHYLFDYVIKQHCGGTEILDFGGSNVESIATFFKSFGAKSNTYCRITKNNLPPILRLLKQ